jgi:hypothetical protein
MKHPTRPKSSTTTSNKQQERSKPGRLADPGLSGIDVQVNELKLLQQKQEMKEKLFKHHASSNVVGPGFGVQSSRFGHEPKPAGILVTLSTSMQKTVNGVKWF